VNVLGAKQCRHEAHHAAAAVTVGRHVRRVYRVATDFYAHGATLSDRNGTTDEDGAATIWAAVLLDDGLASADVVKLRKLNDNGVDVGRARERAVEMSLDLAFRRLATAFDSALFHKPELDEDAVRAVVASSS
jgi:hypothetical protein